MYYGEDFEGDYAAFLERDTAATARRNRRLDALELISDADLAALGPVKWLIDGHIPEDSLSMLFGKPGSAKSFLALGWALHIAGGLDTWEGNTVEKGPVVYVAAEGVKGYHSRIKAWKAKHDWSGPVGIRFVKTALKLGDRAEVDRVIENVKKEGIQPKLFVIDTLHRCFDGEENSARDVGVAIAAMDRIRTATGAAVMFVHHSTKSDGSFRGSSALEGAVDLVIHTTIEGDRVSVTCEKMKDAEPFKPLAFTLARLNGSRVLDLIESGATSEGPKLTPNDQKALDALSSAGEAWTYSEWQERSEIPAGSFGRHRTRLMKLGLVIQRPDERYETAGETTDVMEPDPASADAAYQTLLATPQADLERDGVQFEND